MFDPVIQNGGNMPLRHVYLLGLLYAAYICNVKILPYGNKDCFSCSIVLSQPCEVLSQDLVIGAACL